MFYNRQTCDSEGRGGTAIGQKNGGDFPAQKSVIPRDGDVSFHLENVVQKERRLAETRRKKWQQGLSSNSKRAIWREGDRPQHEAKKGRDFLAPPKTISGGNVL